MIIRLNGEKHEILNIGICGVPNQITINEFLKSLDISADRVAVEINLNIIKKTDYNTVLINEGDSVEIVNFVGGG